MSNETFDAALDVLSGDALPAEPEAPPKRHCESCRAELAEAESMKCGPCLESERRVPRPVFPGPAGTKADPAGEKFVAWTKADMAWKQHPKRETV
jgi:hypothetical protein